MMASRLVSSGSSLPMMVSRSDKYCDSPAAREDEGAQPPTARVPAAKEGGRRRIDPPEAQVPAVEEGAQSGRRWETQAPACPRRSGRRGSSGVGLGGEVRREAKGDGERGTADANGFFCASGGQTHGGGQTHASVNRTSCFFR